MHLVLLRIKILLQNKALLFISIIIPLLFFYFIGVIFNSSEDYSKIPISIIDEDNSDYSKEIINNISENELLRIVNVSLDKAFNLLYKNRIEAIYVFNRGLKEKILNEKLDEIVEVHYLHDSFLATGISDIIGGEILPFIGDVKAAKKVVRTYKKNNVNDYENAFNKSLEYSSKLWEDKEFTLPITFKNRLPNSEDETYLNINTDVVHKQSLLGLSLVFSTIYLMFCSATIIKERESYVYNRLKVIGYKLWEINLSNLIGIFIVGILLLNIHFVSFFRFIEVKNSVSILNGLLVYIAFIFCISSLVMLLTKLFSNGIALQSFALPFVIFIALLGGCIFSIELLPKKAIIFSKITPTYWGIDGLYKSLVLELSFKSIKSNVLILFLMGIVLNLLANLYSKFIKE